MALIQINRDVGDPGATVLAQGELWLNITNARLWGGATAGNALLIDPAAPRVTSFNTRSGAVALTLGDVTGVGGAPLASPALTGIPTAPTAAPGTNTTQLANTAFVGAAVGAAATGVSSFNTRTGAVTLQTADVTAVGALHDVGRNLLHNPLFNIAQRGNGPFTTNVYTLDRWSIFFLNGTESVSRAIMPDAARTAVGDEAFAYSLQCVFAGGAPAASQTTVYQAIEGVRRLSGKTVTVSFWAVAGSALRLGISIDQSFGTGGSPSATVPGNGQSVSLSLGWARYSLTFAIPSTTGKTLGTNGDDCSYLNVWYSAGSTSAGASGNVGVQSGTIQLWGVQLEIGSVATPLEKPDPRYDLSNCQRFYQAQSVAWWGYQAAAGSFGNTVTLPVPMRANPTTVYNNVGNSNIGTVTAAALSQGSVYCLGTATAVGQVIINGNFTASADL